MFEDEGMQSLYSRPGQASFMSSDIRNQAVCQHVNSICYLVGEGFGLKPEGFGLKPSPG